MRIDTRGCIIRWLGNLFQRAVPQNNRVSETSLTRISCPESCRAPSCYHSLSYPPSTGLPLPGCVELSVHDPCAPLSPTPLPNWRSYRVRKEGFRCPQGNQDMHPAKGQSPWCRTSSPALV